MRILISIDYFQPQLGYSEAYLAGELKSMGHTLLVFTSNYYFPFPSYKDTVMSILGNRKLRSGKSKWKGIEIVRQSMLLEIFNRAIYLGHREILEKFKPDIVIANKVAGFNTFVFSLLKETYKYKLVCYDSHLPSEINKGNRFVKEFFYWLFRFFVAPIINYRVDKFIAVQEDTELVMKKYYGVSKKINHIPLGTDINKFHFDITQRDRIRKRLKMKKNDFVIIYTGKIIEFKGVSILFEAFNLLSLKYENIKLLLVGSAPKDYLSYCFSKLGGNFHQRVILTGIVGNDELYKYYSAADVGVWPLQESTSMNDAASSSLSFIVNDTAGVRVRLSNENALTYKKGDYSDLAKKISFLYNNPKVRKKMGRKGRELAERKLSWKKISSEYIKV